MKLATILFLLPTVDCGILKVGRNIIENALPLQKKKEYSGECVVSTDGSSCEAAAQEVVVLESIEYDDQRSLSEASYDVTSPAPIEGSYQYCFTQLDCCKYVCRWNIYSHLSSQQPPSIILGDEYGGDLGEAQLIEADNKDDILEVIRQAREYMNTIRTDPKYSKVIGICHNDDAQCAFWASIGKKTKIIIIGRASFLLCSQ
jgi:hypothetical protein